MGAVKPALVSTFLLVARGGEPAPAGPSPAAPVIEAAPPEPPAEPADPPIAPPRVLAMGTSFVCVAREGRVLCWGDGFGRSAILKAPTLVPLAP